MFRRWNKRARWRLAVGLAALYAFCVMMPSASLALAHVAAHCLTDSHGVGHVHRASEKTLDRAASLAHSHADNAHHEHSRDAAPDGHGETGDKAHGDNCCGLFCVTAIAQEVAASPAVIFAAAKNSPAPADALAGRGPDRINRPPIR
jgi:hypothetical protein